jgi:hypothetical protein
MVDPGDATHTAPSASPDVPMTVSPRVVATSSDIGFPLWIGIRHCSDTSRPSLTPPGLYD